MGGNYRPINKKNNEFEGFLFVEFKYFGYPTANKKLPTLYNSLSK